MTGIEIAKIMYCILKFGGFPIVALLYGFNFHQYEEFFERHFDDVVMLTFGSGLVLGDSLQYFANTVSFDSSFSDILFAIIRVALTSFCGVIFSAIGAWLVRIVSPFCIRKTKTLVDWLKNKLK